MRWLWVIPLIGLFAMPGVARVDQGQLTAKQSSASHMALSQTKDTGTLRTPHNNPTMHWPTAFPGRPYVWTTDLHSGPFFCDEPMFKLAGAMTHAEIEFHRCLYIGCGLERLKVFTGPLEEKYGLDPNPERLKRSFFEHYKNDPEFQRVDVVYCSHPAANCELYVPFNKSMIVSLSTRLEFGRYDDNVRWRDKYLKPDAPDRWKEWVETLRVIAQHPRSIVVANNLYDAAYAKFFAGIDVEYIPSWCGDLNTTYNPTRPEILLGPYRDNLAAREDHEQAWLHPILNDLRRANAVSSTFTFKRIGELYPSYRYTDLSAHPAIVVMPYQVSIMSFFEFYRMNIPIFVPSKELVLEWDEKYKFADERVYGHPQLTIESPGRMSLLNPNNKHNFKHWIHLSDMYNFPHVETFHSWDSLLQLLQTVDLAQISRKMSSFNTMEKKMLAHRWQKIFQKLVPPGTEGRKKMPDSYESGKNDFFNV